MVFADLNADKYTDVITIDAESQRAFSIFLFNKQNLTFDFWRQIQPSSCSKVTNIVVGRSFTSLRLFVTC